MTLATNQDDKPRHRRHLTDSQRAAMWARLDRLDQAATDGLSIEAEVENIETEVATDIRSRLECGRRIEIGSPFNDCVNRPINVDWVENHQVVPKSPRRAVARAQSAWEHDQRKRQLQREAAADREWAKRALELQRQQQRADEREFAWERSQSRSVVHDPDWRKIDDIAAQFIRRVRALCPMASFATHGDTTEIRWAGVTIVEVFGLYRALGRPDVVARYLIDIWEAPRRVAVMRRVVSLFPLAKPNIGCTVMSCPAASVGVDHNSDPVAVAKHLAGMQYRMDQTAAR